MSFVFRVDRVCGVLDGKLYVAGEFEGPDRIAVGQMAYLEDSRPRVYLTVISCPLVNYKYPREDDTTLIVISAPPFDPKMLVGMTLIGLTQMPESPTAPTAA